MTTLALSESLLWSSRNDYCFICRKFLSSDCETDSDQKVFSIRLLCLYLKVKCVSLDNCNTPKVILCSSCAVLNEKLASLIKQLEITQMLINHQVQKLQEALNTIHRNVSETGCLVKVEELFDQESLREVIAEKCKQNHATLPSFN